MRHHVASRSLARLLIVLLSAAGFAIRAQNYSTTPQYNNPTRASSLASAAVTLASGAYYASTNRPSEAGTGRFKLDSWSFGFPIPSVRPDYTFGDIIPPPPLTDLTRAPVILTTNGAFYMAARRQVVAAQAGTCLIQWPMADGTDKVLTYTIGAFPTRPVSRLFWTDNFVSGATNSSSTALPDNTDLSVSFNQVYAKLHYNSSVPDFDLVNSQDTDPGRTARSSNAVTRLDLPAVWIDGNNQLRARNQRGYLIVEYFDTPTLDNSVGYEIVNVGPARVYQSPVVLGERLLPSEGEAVVDGLVASLAKAKDYVLKWSASGSHFYDQIFAIAVNSDVTQPTGDPSKTQILWQRPGNLGVVWPYETHWYSITWPGDRAAAQFVFDSANPSTSPPIQIPTNYTATVVWAEEEDAVLKADRASSTIHATGEGRALIQYQNAKDVWFIPVRSVARTNGAYVSNQEMYWPMGKPLEPVALSPRLQFDGSSTYLSFSTDIQPSLTAELWIKPVAATNNQTLLALLDYPQQAAVQAVLSLTNGFLQLSVLTGGTSTTKVLTSTNAITAGVWSHVAFTKSSSGALALYVNGIPDITGSVTSFNAQSVGNTTYAQVAVGQALQINGAVRSPLSYFSGEIREVRLWSTLATASTLQQSMSANLFGGEAGLQHLITPDWQESATPYSGSLGHSFEVLDKASGSYVPGYGRVNSIGQVPFSLSQRLLFSGGQNWVEVPLTVNRNQYWTFEFWLTTRDVLSSQILLSVGTSTATNLQVGLVDGRLTLLGGGGAGVTGAGVLAENSLHHVTLVTGNGGASLFLDAVSQGVVSLPGTGPAILGTRVLLGAGSTVAGQGNLQGELGEFVVYTGQRSREQIGNDMIASVDATDSTLIRWYRFDQVSPALVGGEIVLRVPDRALGYSASYHGPSALGSTLNVMAGPQTGGIIRYGTGYHPGVYATEGRIIPVNDISSSASLEVWWKNPFTASFLQDPLNIPGTVSRYRLMDPVGAPQLVVAGQNVAGFRVPGTWADATIYYQNDASALGYNPNEEHAILLGTSAYAIRWDLNTASTSPGFVLLQYKDTERESLTYLQPIQVVATNAAYPNFDAALEVENMLQAPKPLIDLVPYSSRSGPVSDPNNRLFKDRKNVIWARSAASSGPPDSVACRWYYPLKQGFYWPSTLGAKANGDPVPFGNTSDGLLINYTIRWPEIVPTLAIGQTLADAMPSASGDGNLPAVTGNLSVEILYDDASRASKTSAVLLDPTTISTAPLNDLNGINTATDTLLGLTYFTLLPPHLRNRVSWDPQTKLLTLTGAIVESNPYPYVLPAWLGTAADPNSDYSILYALSTSATWRAAVDALRKTATVVPNAETPMDSIVLTPTGTAGGYVTLGFNTKTSLNNSGEIVSLHAIRVDTNTLFTGRVLVMYSDNKFDQYTTLRHSGDFGGDLSKYQFEWSYTLPVNGQVPPSPNSSPSSWISYQPATTGLNRIVFGGPGLLTLKDVYFSCHWRCIASNAANTNWSNWTEPAMVQSWLTRALDGINPFEQRLENLVNNQIDLTTSILTQAGKRFVGAVPLNMKNVENYGLIEIYETLLDQARNLSIDAGYSDDDVNASLLDAASKLNELYTLLGDEALSDAKDPTIAWGSRDLNDMYFGSRASSLFAFQGIVPSLLEEELALLRGLDDTTSTPVTTHPVYNRLYWNFTKGINSGEPAYALNYGIPSVVGNPKGSITELDAARLYPQGHGDAYGHYLTALMEYYRLLANTNFTWIPRAEVKTINGVNVTFDYVDERKMAASAVQLARTSVEIMDRTYRRDYSLDPQDRMRLYMDSNTNRAWSVSEWAGRSSQGILFNWILLNSLLPAGSPEDPPQVISRDTVPEIEQLAGLMTTVQDKQDDADRGDSPMGVAANVVPFDLDPRLVDKGYSHFDQVYGRAVTAMQAAHAVLQRASLAGANLRRQDVSLEAFRYEVQQREKEFESQLVDIYGKPYPDDIGPTGAYATGYTGPDLLHFNYIDRDLFNPADAGEVTNVTFHAKYSITGDSLDTLSPVGTDVTYVVNTDMMPVLPASWQGQRASYGKIQMAMGDYVRAWISLRSAIARQQDHRNQLEARLQRLRDHNTYSEYYGAIADELSEKQLAVNLAKQGLDTLLGTLDTLDAEVKSAAEALEKPLPTSFIAGLAAGGDLSFPARVGFQITRAIGEGAINAAKDVANLASFAAGKLSEQLDSQLADNADALAGAEEQSQTVLETTILLSKVNADRDSVYGAAVAVRQALQVYTSLVTRGRQLQTDLLAFRQANASRIQEARYADVIFRTFKNEDLEAYLSAFQQASRYVYAAARVYDYETGLLDPSVVSGQEGDFMGETMRATQLGDMVDGKPVSGTDGSRSLASILARMQANWLVLKGRFGINNPTWETHKISLRRELFRIGSSTNAVVEAGNVSAWQNKLYTYRVADIRQVPQFKAFCQVYSPMGTNEPALVIPFSTEIKAGRNLFGLPLAGGDTVLDSAHFTTKLRGAAVTFAGYTANLGRTLSGTPRAYLVPAGIDRQRTPIAGGGSIRDWRVVDQVWPIPFPSAAGNVNLPLESIGTDNVHSIRRFPPMRVYDDGELSAMPSIPYDGRLIARSVWNTEWVLIIPGSSLASSGSAGLDSLIEGISDIHLVLQTYSYSGN